MEAGTEQIAQAAAPKTLIKVTITRDGNTVEKFLSPNKTLEIDEGSQVVVDAGGLVMKAGVDANGNLTFTHGSDVYTLNGLGNQLTAEKSQLSLYNNQTGSADDVQIADILSGISTAAGGDSGDAGADGGFVDKNGDGVPDGKGTGDGASLIGDESETLDLTSLLDTSHDVVIPNLGNEHAASPTETTSAPSQSAAPESITISEDGSVILS